MHTQNTFFWGWFQPRGLGVVSRWHFLQMGNVRAQPVFSTGSPSNGSLGMEPMDLYSCHLKSPGRIDCKSHWNWLRNWIGKVTATKSTGWIPIELCWKSAAHWIIIFIYFFYQYFFFLKRPELVEKLIQLKSAEKIDEKRIAKNDVTETKSHRMNQSAVANQQTKRIVFEIPSLNAVLDEAQIKQQLKR